MRIGEKVFYVYNPNEHGRVVEPTTEEIREVRCLAEDAGPDYGHVMVEWDYGRYWEDIDELGRITE